MNYCEFVVTPPDDTDNPSQHYHSMQYGLPIEDNNELFERLVLEINRAELSWMLTLKKQQAFWTAFEGFGIDTIAAFDEADIEWLLVNAGIVHNRSGINATIYNAQQIKQIQQEYGSLKGWSSAHRPLDRTEWVKLFRKHFKFIGDEIVGESLMGTGYLPGAHVESYPVYREILVCRPKQAEAA